MTRRMLVGAAAMTLLWVVAGVAVAAGPGSDSFAGATVLTGLPDSASQSVVTATTEVDEDTVTCATISHTVWFSYTPAFDSVLVADTVGSSFDTMLNVWTGSWPFDEATELVACNDDINLGVQVVEETMQAHPDLNGWFFVGLWPLFAEQGSMPLWEAATKSGQIKTVSFDTLPVELEYMKEGYLQGLVGQKYWGWGYDTVQMIYDKMVNGKEFESFTNSGMDIVTPKNVDVMAQMWETQDFTVPLPEPF